MRATHGSPGRRFATVRCVEPQRLANPETQETNMTTNAPTLFSPYVLGRLTLANRVVMSPMTRARAIGNVPNELMARGGDRLGMRVSPYSNGGGLRSDDDEVETLHERL